MCTYLIAHSRFTGFRGKPLAVQLMIQVIVIFVDTVRFTKISFHFDKLFSNDNYLNINMRIETKKKTH